MDQSRKALENEPVLFIAICSGLKPSSVTAYMKSVKSEMAAYADVDRSYEAAVLKATINLKNVHQTMLMKPDGSTHIIGQDPTAWAELIKKEIPSAKWKMDPKDNPVPASLKKAWVNLEFGQLSLAATTIKQASTATDPAVKAAAQKMDAVIKEDITKRMTDAAAKVTAGKKWDGFKGYEYVSQSFKTYPEAAKAQNEMSKLQSDATVKKEMTARMMLGKIQEWAGSQKKTEHETARQGLKQLQEKYADTEAGEASKDVKVPEDKKPEKPAT